LVDRKIQMEGLEVIECESVIVGAGVAGITSAINLLSNNYENFLILEADDQIGGRCKTIRIGF
jgi:monoamine oxidase